MVGLQSTWYSVFSQGTPYKLMNALEQVVKRNVRSISSVANSWRGESPSRRWVRRSLIPSTPRLLRLSNSSRGKIEWDTHRLMDVFLTGQVHIVMS